MEIPVESATFVVADLGDQFLQVLEDAGLNTGRAIGYIALLALASWGYRDTKKDIKEDIKEIKKDIKDLSDKFEDLSDKFGMQQQLNTYASSRAPPPWALTSSRSHSLCELSLAHSPTPRSSDHRPLLTFLPRAPKQSGEYARRPLHVDLHVDLRDLRGGDGSDKLHGASLGRLGHGRAPPARGSSSSRAHPPPRCHFPPPRPLGGPYRCSAAVWADLPPPHIAAEGLIHA